jgi:hypothetical protein
MESRRPQRELRIMYAITAPFKLKSGVGAWGAPFVKFTLTYDGPLLASGNKSKNKWEIRKKLHPQLVDLWGSHPALLAVEDNKHFPKQGGAVLTQRHHLHPGPIYPPARLRIRDDATPALDIDYLFQDQKQERTILDLCEPIEKHGAWFKPLVRESYALHCSLKIRFLRQEPPGRIYQGGDLDGRMKTLIDALAMPQHAEQVLEKTADGHPIHCLLEDDSMMGLSAYVAGESTGRCR